jgi:hypothetical protein
LQKVGSPQGGYNAGQVWEDGKSKRPFVTTGICPLPSGSLLQEHCNKTLIQEPQMKSDHKGIHPIKYNIIFYKNPDTFVVKKNHGQEREDVFVSGSVEKIGIDT